MVGFNITFLQLIANVMVRFKRCWVATKPTYNQMLTCGNVFCELGRDLNHVDACEIKQTVDKEKNSLVYKF